LVSKSGFIKAIYCRVNVAKQVKRSRKFPYSHHSRRANAEAATAVEALRVGNALIVVSVRKETDHKVETVGIPAPVKLGIGQRVHKENVQYAHRVIAPRVRRDRAASVPRVHHVHQENVQRVLKANARRVHRPGKPHRQSRSSKLQ